MEYTKLREDIERLQTELDNHSLNYLKGNNHQRTAQETIKSLKQSINMLLDLYADLVEEHSE